MAKEKTAWEIIREAFKFELAELDKVGGISYNLNTNSIKFYNNEKEFSPTELIDIATKAKNIRSKLLGLIETGKVDIKEL